MGGHLLVRGVDGLTATNLELPHDWPALIATVTADAKDRRLVVLLDGGSGAGKTTLARQLQTDLESLLGPTQLVSLDDAYPGWHGLAQASDWVWQTILRPDDPGHPTWDWQQDRRDGWRPIDPDLPIIVEGCGALSQRSAPLATTRIWYELDAATRRERAIGRDGDGYEPWWNTWAAQETEHWARNQPWTLADLVVRGEMAEDS